MEGGQHPERPDSCSGPAWWAHQDSKPLLFTGQEEGTVVFKETEPWVITALCPNYDFYMQDRDLETKQNLGLDISPSPLPWLAKPLFFRLQRAYKNTYEGLSGGQMNMTSTL